MFKLICLIFISLISSVGAYDASPRCYRDLQLNFFQPSLVSQALSLHRVDQAVWTPIVNNLQESSKKMPEIIERKAQSLSPNPLDPVFIPEMAKVILEEALYEVFFAAFTPYNYYQDLRINGEDIKQMFDYIKDKQASKINGCLKIPSSVKK